MCPEEKIFGVHIRYAKIRRAIAPEWITIIQWQSEALHKGEEHFDYEQAQGPLGLEASSSNFPYGCHR